MHRLFVTIIAGLSVIGVVSCGEGGGPSDGGVFGTPWEWDLPQGFPVPIVPEENPMTVEKVELGRFLFYDEQLSGNGTQACASCHLQSMAFAEDLVVSEGSTGDFTPRNSPTLTNVVYNSSYTWPNPEILTLEQQHLGPMFGEDPVEMGINDQNQAEVLARFEDDPTYVAMFDAAFGDEAETVTFDNIRDAIASFVRILVSGNSPWDQRSFQGVDDAVSESAIRGAGLFFSERLECFHCHGGFNFTNSSKFEGLTFGENPFANTGLYNIGGDGSYPPGNEGLFQITGRVTDTGKFKSPTLRNIAVTAPYFHDGSAATLDEVLDAYAEGGRNIEAGDPLAGEDDEFVGDGRRNPFKSGFINGFELTPEERADVIAFLEALTDETFLTNPSFSDPFAE